ncbi:unnamed protein product [Chrysodeixis includens]|uniref:Protein kinase domain-containing protein n=1 Tax=Chrysodeixis includens TaxID=689277 RepID=A0A9N8L2U2_CHRIL|nr:unnamed protein product [Chrysodeixis includens]
MTPHVSVPAPIDGAGEEVTEEEVQDFLREIEMLKHVGSHKHVIRLIACCTRRAPLIALLEHAPRGDLLSLLRAARGRRKESHSSTVTRRVDSEQGRPSEAESEYTNLSDSDPALSDGKLYIDSDKKKDHYVAEPALQLDGSTMREYALQVALGMRHLEERGITHRSAGLYREKPGIFPEKWPSIAIFPGFRAPDTHLI